MNNIRKIIEERLENASEFYCKTSNINSRMYLQGQIEAYQDCLNLLPAPRTEQDILNDFEKLGWKVTLREGKMITLRYVKNESNAIWIEKDKSYSTNTCIELQEHKLLSELFTIWGWL
jgi:hypothetical protein